MLLVCLLVHHTSYWSSQNDPLDKSNGIITPYLQFTDVTNVELNNKINSGIVNIQKENTDKVIGIIS